MNGQEDIYERLAAALEVALFGGDYQDGVLTAYCAVDDVPHIELNGHILIPLQNIASLHCTSRCDFATVCRIAQVRSLGKQFFPAENNT